MLKFGHQASLADVNNDGRLDILANATIGGNDLQINDGFGHYILSPNLMPNLTVTTSAGWTTQQTNTSSALLDLNNDGHLDMILGCWGNLSSPNPSQVFLGTGATGFASSVPINLPRSGLPSESVVDHNVLHRTGVQSELDYYVPKIDAGTMSRAAVLVGFSESPENQAAVIGVIQNGMTYTV